MKVYSFLKSASIVCTSIKVKKKAHNKIKQKNKKTHKNSDKIKTKGC